MKSQLIRKIPAKSVFVLVCCLGFMASASAQRGSIVPDSGDPGTGGRFVIQGTLYNPAGQRVDRPIRVRLYTPTRGDVTTMTDDNGNFSFRRLSAGNYSIVIDTEKDYEPVNEQINIVQAMRSVSSLEDIVPVQIRLRAKGSTSAKPGVISAEFANVPKPALEFYNKALELAQAGKRKEAIEKLNLAIKEYSGFMLAFNELGVQYMRLGELNKANEALQEALKLSPEAFTPLVNHGVVLVLLKRFAEAEKELRSALKSDDKSAVAHYYLGRALAYQGRFDEGESELNKAITLGGSEMKEAHRYLGAIYHARGDDTRAIAELETYLRVAPKADDAGQVRQMIEQLKGAKKP